MPNQPRYPGPSLQRTARNWSRKGAARWLPLVAVLLALACSTAPHHQPHQSTDLPATAAAPTRSSSSAPNATDQRLLEAIHLAASYLAGAVQQDGRFVYRINLNPNVKPADAYNILRHAGAMYAMAQYQARYPSAQVRAALSRAADYLRRQHIAPLPGQPSLAAVWSDPVGDGLREAKLGGAGLALVALSSLRKLDASNAELDRMRSLARFVAYLQKPDGRYYSKLIPAKGGRWDRWTSLYYPGEAALGTIMLYEQDPQARWLRIAARTLAYLATERRGMRRVPADHWALLATERLLQHQRQLDSLGPERLVSREQLIEHALQICRQIIGEHEKTGHAAGSALAGSSDADGRTTPAATRLEGLMAALAFLPKAHESLRQQLRVVADAGVLFLMRTQVKAGKYAGGIPRAATQRTGEDASSSFNRRATEVRIDYVQHALSAWLAYADLQGG